MAKSGYRDSGLGYFFPNPERIDADNDLNEAAGDIRDLLLPTMEAAEAEL